MGTTDGMGPIHREGYFHFECGDLNLILLGSKIKQLQVHIQFMCHYHFTVKQSCDGCFTAISYILYIRNLHAFQSWCLEQSIT